MSQARQQQGIYVHGDKVTAWPVHGGLVPTHGSSPVYPAGPAHGSANLDPSAAPPAITAPTLTLTSATGATPEWDTAIGADTFAGYYLHIEASATGTKNGDGSYTTPTQNILHQITNPDLVDGISHSELVADGWVDPSGTWFLECRVEREDGTVSPWSNQLTGTVTSSVATLETVTGTGKIQYIAVTGSPALTGTMNANVGAPCLVRTETAPLSSKFHFEVTILGLSDRTGVTGSVAAGCSDSATNLNSGFPVPGVGVPGFGFWVTRGSTVTRLQVNGASGTSGASLNAVPAIGDIMSFDVNTGASPPTVLIRYWRAADSSIVTVANLSLTSQVPTNYRADAGGYYNNFAGGVSGDSFKTNFGATAFTVTPSAGYGIYG